MKDLFLSKELSHLAKEKGFNEECIASYEGDTLSLTKKPWKNSEDNTETAAPLYQQIIDWFREKHFIQVEVIIYITKHRYFGHVVSEYDGIDTEKSLKDNYYSALDEAILEAFKLI